ncbi:MAG: preprotein translocase subunit SecE [Ilumatobacteraceae bacterium]|nr:preprotein translocase subunit SecE [Ilumatobacteraceae bacterium]
MSTDMNREQKRALKRMGALNEQGNPTRTPAQPRTKKSGAERIGPVRYLREVREEMSKVAWPKWPEVRRYSIVVLGTVVLFTAYIGGLDAVFAIFSGWLYKD